MRATGIVRRVDDLGRVVIPKDIRKMMNIREGEALEIFTEDRKVIFQKYFTPEENIPEMCAKWVNTHMQEIKFVNCVEDVTICSFNNGGTRMATVRHNPKDKFDLNVAICYCAKKAGYYIDFLP